MRLPTAWDGLRTVLLIAAMALVSHAVAQDFGVGLWNPILITTLVLAFVCSEERD